MPARSLAVFVFLAVAGTMAFIGPATTYRNPNVVTRMALTFAMLEDHSLRIDRFAPFTIDKAEHDGHFYADKAPGISVLAVPIVAALRLLFQVLGQDTTSTLKGLLNPSDVPRFFFVAVWICSALVSGVAAGLSAAVVVWLVQNLGGSWQAARLAGIGLGFATPLTIWGTVLFGHSLAGALLLFIFARILVASAAPSGHDLRHGVIVGLLMATAVVVEFPSVPAVACLGVFGVSRLLRLSGSRARRQFTGAVLGGIAGIAPLLLYNTFAFGGPFRLGYGMVAGFEGMRTGYFGVSLPHWNIVLALLFGPERGLLWISPFLVLFPFGLWAAWRRMPRDAVAVCAAIPIAFLLVNAGYAYWDGGGSTGPRHLTPAMGFACLPIAALWDRAGQSVRTCIEAMVAASAVIALTCSLIDPASPQLAPGRSPLLDVILPRFLAADFHNALLLFNVRGFLSLLPLPFIWLAAAMVSRAFRHARPA